MMVIDIPEPESIGALESEYRDANRVLHLAQHELVPGSVVQLHRMFLALYALKQFPTPRRSPQTRPPSRPQRPSGQMAVAKSDPHQSHIRHPYCYFAHQYYHNGQ